MIFILKHLWFVQGFAGDDGEGMPVDLGGFGEDGGFWGSGGEDIGYHGAVILVCVVFWRKDKVKSFGENA